jgi:MFS family permease
MAITGEANPVGSDVRQRGGFIVSGLAAGHIVFHWIIQSFIVVLPEIQSAFQLNAVGVGGILTVRELASGLVSLPGGVVVDLIRKRWGTLLAVCLGVSGLGSLVMGFSPVYPLLLIGLAAVAISHSIWHLPASASISYHVPHRRGMALAFHGVGGSVGDVAGPLVTGALLAVLGWRGILSAYAVAPLFFGFLAIWAFKNIGATREVDATTADVATRIEMTRRLIKNRVLWGIAFVGGLRSMALVALVTLLPLYLAHELALSPFSRGFHIGLLIAVGLVAKPLMGNLSDRWGRKTVLVPGLIWSAAFSLMLIPNGQGVELTVTIALLGLFLYPDQPILTAAALETMGKEVATTGLGFIAFIRFMMAASSSLIVGGLYEGVSVDAALYYIAGLFGVAAVVLASLPLRSRRT